MSRRIVYGCARENSMNTISRYLRKIFEHARNGSSVGATDSRGLRDYATAADFQVIFTEEVDALYLLAFLLMANHVKAEACLVSGIEECVDGTQIFKEWARSWARRTIIRNAIHMISPRSDSAGEAPPTGARAPTASPIYHPLAAVLRLKSFERFVFVMSIFEKYSDHECSSLLSCSVQEVVRGRSRALQESALSDGLASKLMLPELGQLATHHGRHTEPPLHQDAQTECHTG